jgi:hypothetical protein
VLLRLALGNAALEPRGVEDGGQGGKVGHV